MWIDGLDEQTGAWSNIEYTEAIYSGIVALRWVQTSPLELSLEVDYGDQGNSGTIHVEIVALDLISHDDLYLRLGITEDSLFYNGEWHHQVLRDYVPNRSGIPLSIAQGDTFSHSEAFVIQEPWISEHSQVVAFVQSDGSRDVIQSAQYKLPATTPVVSEIPAGQLPDGFQLSQNYPNPFNPETEIRYSIPGEEHVTMKVFNILGAEVATLVEGQQAAGSYSVRWDGGDMGSGVYFCRLEAGDYHNTIKMVLLK